MACRDLDLLWKIYYFRDPSQFWDSRNNSQSKHCHTIPFHPVYIQLLHRSQRSPHVRHKRTRQAIWVDGRSNLPELRRRSPVDVTGSESCTAWQAHHNSPALLKVIKACGRQKDLHRGSKMHADIRKTGLLKKDIYVGTALLHMYAKCGALAKAQEVFDELPARDVVSWNALIAGYTEHGHSHGALKCFGRMLEEGLFPNAVTFTCILKVCGSIGAIRKGEKIHSEVCRMGLMEKHNIVLGTALVSMYAKCGVLQKAQEVFDELPAHDVVCWNALIAGYAEHGHSDEALKCFGQMQDEGLSPDAVTFTCILKACGDIGALEKGKEIHADVHRLGLMGKHDIVLGNAVVSMYAKCGALSKAQEVFDKLPAHDIVSWNALIAGYAEHGHGDEALKCFGHMQNAGLSPDAVTFTCVLKACGSIGATEKGEEIHAELCRLGLMENHGLVIGTALVSMYAKCGALPKAQEVFDKLATPNVVSWNALIAGYAEHGHADEALKCFERMQDEGFSPDAVTFICILKACGSIGATEKGKDIHAKVQRLGLMKNHNIVLGTALVSMYAKCGALAKAQEVFDELPVWDVASWNALIAGYAEHGHGDEALKCFGHMQDKGFSPNAVTFTCIFKACGSIGATEKGEEIHAELHRLGLMENHNILLGNALVSMYAKCGALPKAQEVFDRLPAQDVVSWNALITAYAELGNAKKVIDSFHKMFVEHLEPNGVTFVILLTACSHAGLVEEGLMYFDTMSTVYCMIPTVEHYICMVDLLSRAGQFSKAMSIIQKEPNFEMWMALLSACRKWVNVELGRWAFEHAIRLDGKCAAAYVCMSNIYATAGLQEEADKVEILRKRNGALMIQGRCWWTDIGRNVHSFTAGDNSHPQSEHINAKLNDIGQALLAEGYSPRLHWMSQAMSDEEKEDVLCGHCEKLAIACALINTPEGTPIRVTKNMRLCADCHFSTSLISKMEKRIIHVKDANRIHIFEDGKCICEEYW